jgi:hypothetical protein
VSERDERIFSVLVALDPVTRTARTARTADAAAADGALASMTADGIARIIAQPRPTPDVIGCGTGVAAGSRLRPPRRVGALGVLASAAIAAVAMLLWAPPSAGQPPHRSINVATNVAPAASSSRASEPDRAVTVGRT